MNERIIISLGGSLVVPEDIDSRFIQDFKNVIESSTHKGQEFFIIVGGGKICRKYQNIAKQLANPTSEELDLIGIRALNLNAELVRTIFRTIGNVSIFGAEKPGSSTDLGAVELAIRHNSKKVINLSNTDYVYDSDPKSNPGAKKIDEISWAEYRKLIPNEWNPGLNSPFDPVASKAAQAAGVEVIIMNGKPITNLANYLEGKSFQGTVIS